jgi:hypothetical protein
MSISPSWHETFLSIHDTAILVGALEDPAEDVFVSRVLIPGHDCLILEGVYESAAFHVQRFVNILEEMPDTGNYVLMKRAAYGLLKLSNEVVRRSGVEPFAVGGELPLRHIMDGAISNLAKRSERVRFSVDELRALGIDPEDLSTFVFHPARRDILLDEQIGGSSLERQPLSAKIVRMPPPVVLTDEDLEITESACRCIAARCLRQDAIEKPHTLAADSRQHRPRADPAMLPRGLNTLADLGDSHVIYSDCDRCSRSVKLNTAQLSRKYGAELTIAALRYRLTCRNCGGRPRDIRIVYPVSTR